MWVLLAHSCVVTSTLLCLLCLCVSGNCCQHVSSLCVFHMYRVLQCIVGYCPVPRCSHISHTHHSVTFISWSFFSVSASSVLPSSLLPSSPRESGLNTSSCCCSLRDTRTHLSSLILQTYTSTLTWGPPTSQTDYTHVESLILTIFKMLLSVTYCISRKWVNKMAVK